MTEEQSSITAELGVAPHFDRVPVRDLQNPALRNLARLDQALSEETPSISHFPVQIDI